MTESSGPSERETLATFLDEQRQAVVRKAAGLTEQQARWSPVPSGTSIFGLLAHLTGAERWWFATVVGGLDVPLPWPDDDSDPDADWRGDEYPTLADAVAAYEAECARSREIVAARGLDEVVAVPTRGGMTVREVVVHLIEETARHAGHADLVREQLDGVVGW